MTAQSWAEWAMENSDPVGDGSYRIRPDGWRNSPPPTNYEVPEEALKALEDAVARSERVLHRKTRTPERVSLYPSRTRFRYEDDPELFRSSGWSKGVDVYSSYVERYCALCGEWRKCKDCFCSKCRLQSDEIDRLLREE